MIISHSKKFIFIHNYKVAGTSVRDTFSKYNNRTFLSSRLPDKLKIITGEYPKIYSAQFDHHIKAPELKRTLDSEIFNEYFKFGLVRNPWDWQVSLYKFMLKRKDHWQHELAKKFKGFDDYLDWRVNEDLHLQKEFFYEENQCLMDYIGKMETLDNDFPKICERLEVKLNLTHKNKSRPVNEGFKKYYSQKTIDMVDEAFSDDIKLFDYDKPIL